jgi:hypothetical protein
MIVWVGFFIAGLKSKKVRSIKFSDKSLLQNKMLFSVEGSMTHTVGPADWSGLNSKIRLIQSRTVYMGTPTQQTDPA